MLNYIVDSIDNLDEGIQKLYEKGDDGKFTLQVQGVVPKARLDEFRDKNIQLMQQMDKFKDIDPAKYTALLELQRKVDESKLVESGKIDEAVEQRVKTLTTEYEDKLSQSNTKYEAVREKLEKSLLSSQLSSQAIKAGAHESAIDDIESRARQVYKLVNDDIVPMDSKGNVIYGKNGADPMPMSEWLKSLAKDAPHLFKTSEGGDSRNGGNGKNLDRNKMSATQKIESALQ